MKKKVTLIGRIDKFEEQVNRERKTVSFQSTNNESYDLTACKWAKNSNTNTFTVTVFQSPYKTEAKTKLTPIRCHYFCKPKAVFLPATIN